MTLYDKMARKGADFLGVRHPILCGAMTWISDSHMVKAVGQHGAFPVLAAGNMPPEEFEAELDRCIASLDTPFAANLITIAPNYPAHLEIVKRKDVPFVIFAGNIPRRGDVKEVKAAGKRVMSFASTQTLATQLIRYGVDALILEGNEAGGHIGYVSLIVLLQQVLVPMRDFPIFVAGGLGTGQIMAHLMMMGAWGCQFGTRFVMTEECRAHPRFKKAFLHAHARQAVATPQYDSQLPVVAVRALKNRGMEAFGTLQFDLIQQIRKGEMTREQAQFEVERFWIGSLRRAVVDGDVDTGSLMAGQSVGLMRDIKPMKDSIQELVDQADAELQRIAGQVDQLRQDGQDAGA